MTPQLDSPPGTISPLSFATRFWLAWVCLWNVLVDGLFAGEVQRLRQLRQPAHERGTEPQLAAPAPVAQPAPAVAASPVPTQTPSNNVEARPDPAPALQLLALLQREGRLVDFLQQDITPFSDTQVGQVARVVHAGCRKAMAAHADIEPVFTQPEASRIELAVGFDPAVVKLTGQVQGAAPYRGTLRHRGWRATRLALPTALPGHDAQILAPAEVEL